MSSPYLSEIRMMSFNFAPKGWALCNGQLLSISQYQPLFSLLGTTYGGDGIRTFGLPNLQGNVPLGWGTAANGTYYNLGQASGEANHTLLVTEIPQHNHVMTASAAQAPLNATGRVPGPTVGLAEAVADVSNVGTPVNTYGTASPTGIMAGNALANEGGNQPHANQQPYAVINFCIALQGIFPSRN